MPRPSAFLLPLSLVAAATLQSCSSAPRVGLEKGETTIDERYEIRPRLGDVRLRRYRQDGDRVHYGLLGPDGERLVEPDCFRVAILGRALFVQKERGGPVVRRPLVDRSGLLVADTPQATPFIEVWRIRPRDNVVFHSQRKGPPPAGTIVGAARAPGSDDQLLIDEAGKVLATAPAHAQVEGFGDDYLLVISSMGKFSSGLLLDRQGRVQAPTIPDLDYHAHTFAIDLGNSYSIPVSPYVGVPCERPGFLGYRRERGRHRPGPIKLPFYWKDYEIDGHRLYGYATLDLEYDSGPRWSDVQFWEPERFLPGAAGYFVIAREAESGQYQAYELFAVQEGFTAQTPGRRPLAMGPPGPTREAAIASLQGVLRELNQKEVAKLDDIYAREQARRRQDAERAEAARKFAAAMAAGDKNAAGLQMTIAGGDAAGRYYLRWPDGVQLWQWRAAANAATTPELVTELRQRVRDENARLLARMQAAETARAEEQRRKTQVNVGAYLPPSRGPSKSSDQRIQEIRAYTKALQDWTYGRSSWRPTHR